MKIYKKIITYYFTELTEEESYSFKIVFHCEGGRTYFLCTNSQASMEAWMKALACASYDYMKLMVAELQRQLDEAQGKKMHPFFYLF